jgi:hypothetical protein
VYIPDLTEYGYLESYLRAGLLAIGWLDADHAFPTGDAPEQVLDRLWKYIERPIAQTRGWHSCPFCATTRAIRVRRDAADHLLGDAEIRVFSNTGEAYAAPNLIHHYMETHRYLPPAPFLDAVRMGPLPGTATYEALIQGYTEYDEIDGWS